MKSKEKIFVEHIERHLEEYAGVHHVICKICGKTIDQIYKEEKEE